MQLSCDSPSQVWGIQLKALHLLQHFNRMILSSFLAAFCLPFLNCAVIPSGKICVQLLNLKYQSSFATAAVVVVVAKIADQQTCSKLVTSDLFLQSLQSDLEAEQVKVNSLTHMVVIVDESSGESATAILEEQLQVKSQSPHFKTEVLGT